MANNQQFAYTALRNDRGEVTLRPQLTFTLAHGELVQSVAGLLDTGADVNVLPYRTGLALGAVWSEQTTAVVLSGNLARYEARGVIFTATVAQFPPVRLAFAWTQADDVPLILGQVNFFMEFDVCFYRSQAMYSIQPK